LIIRERGGGKQNVSGLHKKPDSAAKGRSQVSQVAGSRRLAEFALNSDGINFDIQNDEAPQLIELEVHPEFFGAGKLLLAHGFLQKMVIQESVPSRAGP
jgi:hypothetical protein